MTPGPDTQREMERIARQAVEESRGGNSESKIGGLTLKQWLAIGGVLTATNGGQVVGWWQKVAGLQETIPAQARAFEEDQMDYAKQWRELGEKKDRQFAVLDEAYDRCRENLRECRGECQ